MKEILSMIILALIIEKCIGIFKDFKKKKFSPTFIRTMSLILSIILTIITKMGILHIFKIILETVNSFGMYVDYIVTGVIISRVSNVVHDLLSLLEKFNKNIGIKK